MAESFRTTFAHNLSATTNPGATNDVTQGYSAGSIWVNVTAGLVWFCTAGTVSAANWALASSSSTSSQMSRQALSNTTIPASVISGQSDVTFINTATIPGTLTTRTAAQLLADAPGAVFGAGYNLRVCNGGLFAMTLAPGTGVSFAGSAVIQPGTYVDFIGTFTSATALVFQATGTGPFVQELVTIPKPL